jgi:hypothetical protein
MTASEVDASSSMVHMDLLWPSIASVILASRRARRMLIRARDPGRDAIREVTLAAYQEYAALMPGFWTAIARIPSSCRR